MLEILTLKSADEASRDDGYQPHVSVINVKYIVSAKNVRLLIILYSELGVGLFL
jgi:hypothetical protein